MPLLPLETSLFPEDLLTNPPGWEGGVARWWVLQTRPRAEKCLARRLLRRGVPFYLPLHQRRWRCRGRLLESCLPLFPGYVFLHGDGGARIAALETQLVTRSLPVGDQDRLHADLARVHQLVATGVPLTPEDRLLPGTPVEITSGPLAGFAGKVLRRGKHWKIYVEVEFLRRGVSAELDIETVRPLRA
jgi:transcriptional antiterminator RfaH